MGPQSGLHRQVTVAVLLQGTACRGISQSACTFSDPVKGSDKTPTSEFDHVTGMEKCDSQCCVPHASNRMRALRISSTMRSSACSQSVPNS